MRQLPPRDWAVYHFIIEGDSLPSTHGSSIANRMPARMMSYAPLLGAATHSMVAIGGQTIQDMIDNAADVDGAYVAGKKNVLVTFAGTNGMIDGAAAQVTRMRQYIAARKAAHPDLLVMLGFVPPRYELGSMSVEDRNNEIVKYNRAWALDWRNWGVDVLVDTRPAGGPFDLPDWSLASFTRPATLPMWSTADAPGVYTHFSDVAHAYEGRCFANSVHRLPV
jgi:hypothetical protein